MKIDTELWKTGWAELATLIQAKADLAGAQVDAADTSEAKVLLLAEAVKAQTEYVTIAEVRARAGWALVRDVDRERRAPLGFQNQAIARTRSSKGTGEIKGFGCVGESRRRVADERVVQGKT